MNEVIFKVKSSDKGGFTASAIGYSIFTEADSLEELKINTGEAVLCHFDDDISRIIKLQ